MHGVHVPERGSLSVVQASRRKGKQPRHGFTQNGLESICDSHRGMPFLPILYLVGVYQRAVMEGSARRFPDIGVKVIDCFSLVSHVHRTASTKPNSERKPYFHPFSHRKSTKTLPAGMSFCC